MDTPLRWVLNYILKIQINKSYYNMAYSPTAEQGNDTSFYLFMYSLPLEVLIPPKPFDQSEVTSQDSISIILPRNLSI